MIRAVDCPLCRGFGYVEARGRRRQQCMRCKGTTRITVELPDPPPSTAPFLSPEEIAEAAENMAQSYEKPRRGRR